MKLTADRLVPTKNPSAADIHYAAADADFPVILPAGLPEERMPTQLLRNRSVILLSYDLPGAWRRSNHMLWIILANPAATLGPAPKRVRGKWVLRLGGMAGDGNVRWMIGHEEVIVPKSTITPAELARIKSAMIARSQQPGGTR